jgi:hypothetical protein
LRLLSRAPRAFRCRANRMRRHLLPLYRSSSTRVVGILASPLTLRTRARVSRSAATVHRVHRARRAAAFFGAAAVALALLGARASTRRKSGA